MDANEFTPAVGFEDWYLIDRAGNVIHKDGTPKATEPRKGGYRSIVRYQTNGRVRGQLHRVMYASFIGQIPDGMEVDHIDRDPTNNALDNLRLVTRSGNKSNSNKRRDASHSRYIGVIDSGGGCRGTGTRFRARVKKDGKPHFSHVFKCETAAAIARDKIAIGLFGSTVSLNFPTLFGRQQASVARPRTPSACGSSLEE